nr:putative reverse transcriptase domain-containing protein [Tanacetum cinerariifolium]
VRAGGPVGGPTAAPMARECSFTGFMKCGSMQFHETEGAVGLVRWFEKMVATLGREVANGRPWTEVKQVMTDEFCPTEEVQRLEDELRHLKLRDMNIAAYTERIMPPKRRSQTNPQPTKTQEDVDQLVRDGIEVAIRDEREKVRMEETRAGGPVGGPTAAPMARECSFTGFMKCGSMQFHETEGAVGLVRWFEKMVNTFEISECAEEKKVKFATATLYGRALTW